MFPMSPDETFPGPESLERPKCSKCQGWMMLERIQEVAARDILEFRCARCGNTQSVAVER